MARDHYIYPFTHRHTVKDVVPRMHLAELRHVFDWVTTGRGGAYAGLAGDASSFQSAQIETQRNSEERFSEGCRKYLMYFNHCDL